MTRAKHRSVFSLVLLFVSLSLLSSFVVTNAQTITFHLEHEWVKIWINGDDGSIDLLYDIILVCDSGTINWIEVSQPVGDFTLGQANDSARHSLIISKIVEGSYYAVRVNLASPLLSGTSIRFNVTTNVRGMIYLDDKNPGNAGMLFTPAWWQGASVRDLRLLIVFPPGLQKDVPKTLTDVPYNNAYYDPAEGGKLVYFWQRSNLSPGAQLSFGVSFPKDYIKSGIHYTGLNYVLYDFLPHYWFVLLGGGLVVIFGTVLTVNYVKRHPYEKPRIRMESLGIRRGLTAVEASWLLGLGPQKIVVEILYSLLKKHAVWVKEQKPVMKLEVVKPSEGAAEATTGEGNGGAEAEAKAEAEPLRYYELSFIRSIGEDGTLDERSLAGTVMLVRDTVEEKMRGYHREDTIKYYRKIVNDAWEQVRTAGTPELAAQAFDDNLLWLILDNDFKTRSGEILGDRPFPIFPSWWWYLWWRYPQPLPPTRAPIPSPEARTPLPGGEFANGVATALENAAGGIVKNLENFANAIVPAAPKSVSNTPIRQGSSCACACVSCACVCACVSCACACAGGRVG